MISLTQTYQHHSSWRRTEHNQRPCPSPRCTSPGRRGVRVFLVFLVFFCISSTSRISSTSGTTHPHSAVHAAVARRCVLPAVRSIEEPPVPVVAKVALVRPPFLNMYLCICVFVYLCICKCFFVSGPSTSARSPPSPRPTPSPSCSPPPAGPAPPPSQFWKRKSVFFFS